MSAGAGAYARIYRVVRRIPRGRVATYGQIAALAGLPGHARQVGYALHATPDDTELPWHRVINARGEISPRHEPLWEGIQAQLLAAEDVTPGANGRIDLTRFQWRPRK
jgi:methylated-DNA-protein-cysteine methyltransferase-like protein